MKNFSTWLLVMFMILFWGFRVLVALTYEMQMDFGGIVPINPTIEIILLFVVFVCLILIVKRKLVGGLIYFGAYGIYFGTTLVNGIKSMIENSYEISNVSTYMNTFIAFVGIILSIAVLFDLILDKGRKANPKDKKTDWFYKNEKFDRKMDERADKNNYRTL